MKAAIVGFGGSSTRAEIAAGIIAMASHDEVHMGTDSQSFLTRARVSLNMIENKQTPKRPWSTQKDGDLWHTFCDMAKQKGPESIRISMVRGHATEKKNLGDGIVNRIDKEGSDKADKYAEEGVKGHTEELVKMSRVLATRQSRYVIMVKNIHDHILEAFYERK